MKIKKTNIMELLQKEEKIWVNIKPIQRREFLKFAKDNGFKWINGDEISLNDGCWLVVAMFVDRTITNIPAMHRAFGNDRYTVYKINFIDLCAEEV